MPVDLASLSAPTGPQPPAMGGGDPSQQQGQPQQGQPSSLAGLLKAQKQTARPPGYDHVLAATHYFREVNRVMEPLLQDEKLGKSNIRPRLFDAIAKLIGERVMSLTDAMIGIKTLPEDPAEQKAWLLKLVKSNEMAQNKVMDDYQASQPDWMGDMQQSKWSTDTHQDHMKELKGRYAG